MQKFITQTCQSCYYQLRRISAVRKYLSTDATSKLVTSLILSRLDYCNSLLAGLPESSIHPLQRIQNSAARLVLRKKKSEHITPLSVCVYKCVCLCLPLNIMLERLVTNSHYVRCLSCESCLLIFVYSYDSISILFVCFSASACVCVCVSLSLYVSVFVCFLVPVTPSCCVVLFCPTPAVGFSVIPPHPPYLAVTPHLKTRPKNVCARAHSLYMRVRTHARVHKHTTHASAQASTHTRSHARTQTHTRFIFNIEDLTPLTPYGEGGWNYTKSDSGCGTE